MAHVSPVIKLIILKLVDIMYGTRIPYLSTSMYIIQLTYLLYLCILVSR